MAGSSPAMTEWWWRRRSRSTESRVRPAPIAMPPSPVMPGLDPGIHGRGGERAVALLRAPVEMTGGKEPPLRVAPRSATTAP